MLQRLKSASPKLLGLCVGLFLLASAPVAEAQGEICRTCSITDRCTGTVITASGCCTFPEYPVCAIAFQPPAYCVGSVTVACLHLNF